MDANDKHDEKQLRKSAFTIMSNVRDLCQQPDMRKFLLLVIATYCDSEGSCYPSNETLAKAIGKSGRTVKRMLRELVADGEIEILAPGIGRDQKRVLCLRRYAGKGDKAVSRKGVKAVSRKGVKAMTRLNGRRSGAKRPVTDTDNCQLITRTRMREAAPTGML